MRKYLIILFFIPLLSFGQSGLWRLNGNTTDQSINGYNGTAFNISYVQGQDNQAASFNGTSSGIVFPLTNAFPIGAAERTLNLWFYATSPQVTAIPVLLNYGSGGAGLRFQMKVDTTNVSLVVVPGTGSLNIPITSWKNKWIMFTVTFPAGSDSSNDFNIYVNGSKAAVSSYGTIVKINTTQSTASPCLGAVATTTTPTSVFFKGYIDKFEIWPVAWTPAQIKNEYSLRKHNFQ